jgi:hypothetical protein
MTLCIHVGGCQCQGVITQKTTVRILAAIKIQNLIYTDSIHPSIESSLKISLIGHSLSATEIPSFKLKVITFSTGRKKEIHIKAPSPSFFSMIILAYSELLR